MGKSTINGHFQWLYMVLMSLHFIDSGYPLVKEHSYWKSPFVMGKLTISMAIFHSYFDITRSGIPYFDRLGRKWPAWRPRLRGLPTSERRRGREVSVSPSGALELQQLGCKGNIYICSQRCVSNMFKKKNVWLHGHHLVIAMGIYSCLK